MSWTPERTETLINLFESGQSRGAIALHLGVTRNAVIGKINRLARAGKLGDQPVRKATRKPGRKAARKPRKRSASSPVSAGRVVSPAGPAEKRRQSSTPPCEAGAVTSPSIAPDADAVVSDLPASDLLQDGGAIEGPSVSLVEAEQDQCRFPIWPHMAMPDHPNYGQVCGAPVRASKPGQPLARYCAHHHGVVTGNRDETNRATRIVRATVRQARAQGVA